jgi:hypothetical protein
MLDLRGVVSRQKQTFLVEEKVVLWGPFKLEIFEIEKSKEVKNLEGSSQRDVIKDL